MLVITRKTNEEIRIGDEIVLKVISNSNGRVKLGIEAPKHVRVVRSEILVGHCDDDSEKDNSEKSVDIAVA